MMRKLIAAAALAVLVTTTASAAEQKLKPGTYAQNSAVYAELLRACQRSYERHFSSDNVRALKLEDDAARYAEKLYKDNPQQFKLQVKGCLMSLPKPAAQQPKAGIQRVSSVPPAAYIGAGAAVGAAVARAATRRNGQSYGDDRRRLSPEQRKQLNELRAVESEEVLGPRPANSRGYLGHRRGHQPVPHGCSEVKKPSEDGRTVYVRVICR